MATNVFFADGINSMATRSVMPTAFVQCDEQVPEERPILLRKVLTLGNKKKDGDREIMEPENKVER